jgi:hypothetical protein
MTSATIHVQQAGGTCFSLERLHKIAHSEEKEAGLLFNKDSAHATLAIAATNTARVMSSAKDSDWYTTVGCWDAIITSSPKLCSLSPSPPCTNGMGMRRNPFNEMFLAMFLPAFSNSSCRRCAPADAIPGMSAKGSPGSGKQKMNLVDKPGTVLYADEVKKYEELAKRGSSAVFFWRF